MNEQKMHPFERILFERFGGHIQAGEHDEREEAACALEMASLARGRGLSYESVDAELPMFWPISDGLGIWPDDKTRTVHVLPLVTALWDWPQWSKSQEEAWKGRILQRTIQEILPFVLRPIGLIAEADRCAQDGDLGAALAAREAAREIVKTAHGDQDAMLVLRAVRVRESARFVVRAARSRDDFELAYAAYHVASSLHCIAIGRGIAAREALTDSTCYRNRDATAGEILALACRIWREEADQVLNLKSH
jgi:hypothetical protein